MAHYTGHKFTLTELNTIEQQKSDFLDSLNIKLASPELLVKDMALMLKALEVMENLEHLPEYKDFIINVGKRSAQFVLPTELIANGGFDVTYNTANLVQNPNFSTDAFEIELVKNSGFDVPVDLSRPWANGIAYKFDVLTTEGTQIIRAYTDGKQTAITWFETQLKPNTQYKFSYDLVVNDVNWDLPGGGFNMVDVPSIDTGIFSETGGGPDPKQIVVSIIEDANLVLPTCNDVVVPWDNSVDYNLALAAMEVSCTEDDSVWNYDPDSSSFYCDTGAGYPGDGSATQEDCYASNAVWFEGALTDPNTQQHIIVPYNVEAREGDTLIFTNPVGNYLVHNAVSDDNISFASPDLNPGDVWNWEVDGYHDIYFHCTFHPLEEGRLTSTTNHRYVYNIDHGLNPGDTVKIPINYGAMVNLPSLANSYFINLTLPNLCTSLGGAGDQTAIDSLYHDVSINQIVTFQSGVVEDNPEAAVPVDVTFDGGIETDTLHALATATVVGGIVDSILLTYIGDNYSSIPVMYISGGGGTGASGDVEFDGKVTTINVIDGGSGYASAPTVVISDPDVAQLGPDGACQVLGSCTDVTIADAATCEAAGETWTAYSTESLCTNAGETWEVAYVTTTAEATATLTPTGELESITVTSPGAGYHGAPTITLLGGTPTVAATVDAEVDGTIYSITLTDGGTGYGSADNAVAVGERRWEEYIVTAVAKGDERVDVFLDDQYQIGHTHTLTITPEDYVQIKLGYPTLVTTNVDNTGHTHTATFDWDPTLNGGAGGMYMVGITGSHTHGLDSYYEITGGTKVELVNFGHYHELLITVEEEAALKASPLLDTTQDVDGTWSATSGLTYIKTSDFGTSDPQHFHTVEFGCLDADNDIYLIIEIDQHIHDFGRVWYPGSSQFNIGWYDYSIGGDDLNPVSIAIPFTDIPGYVKKEKGIESDAHGLAAGDRVHFENVYNGIHHGNTNYWIDYLIDQDHFALTEVVVYPLENSQGTTPSEFNVIEEYTVFSDLTSYRFQVERDLTNHVGSPFVEGVQIEWSRPNTVKSVNHGLSVGDVVQLPSGPQPYTPSELPGEMRDHTVVGLGDGYGPTDNMEIIVDTVEGAQDSPWYWSWWDHSSETYFPYQVAGATYDSFGGNDGTNGGFNLYRGGTYKFTNNAWSVSGHITLTDPISGVPQPMYMHAAGIKGITGAGWDNLVEAGFNNNDDMPCVSMRANHGLTLDIGAYNDFVSLDDEPGTWVGDESFPACASLGGWCEELDVNGWYYNGLDTPDECALLNPTEDPGLAQWRTSQWIGNFSKEFTWKIPEDFGLTGSDGVSGLGPFVPPGEVNGAYHITDDGGLYRFDKSGMIEGTNRTINLYRGGTYKFKINAPGHEIYVTTDSGQYFTPGAFFGEYLLGVNNTRAEVGLGDQLEGNVDDKWGLDDDGVEKFETLTWTVPEVAPDTMYYQCAWHASMMGQFNILDLPVVNAGEDITVYFHHGQDNMYTPLHILDKIVVDNGTGPNFFQIQPTPEYPFPVKGTQADLLLLGNALTATGPGSIPNIQSMDIELGTVQYIDPFAMIPGIGSEQFLVTNDFSGLAKVYISVDKDYRSDIELSNVSFKEVVWTETGSWTVEGGTAFTSDTDAAHIEQIVTGSITDGVTYEIQYDIIESFKDNFGAEIGSLTAELRGDAVVQGTANTAVGHYTETLVAPNNTTLLRLVNSGKGKIDNVSIKERVTGQNAWSLGEGWTSDMLKAYIDGSIASTTEVSQSVAIETGKLYEVKYNLGNVDDNDNGMSGRLRVALGTNPNNLISNWNFDITDPVLVNWGVSGSDVVINGDKLSFNSSTNGTAEYTFASAIVGGVKYEVSIDVDLVEDNILNFQCGPGPTATHSHTFQMTQSDAEWLQESAGNSLTFTQTDGYHADSYTHDFTIIWTNIGGVQGYFISEQTNPEGHDELTLVSTTINNPSVEVIINGTSVGTVTSSGITHINFIGVPTTTLTLKFNDTGAVNSIKLVEENIAAIDYNTDGLNQDGEKTYHVRAGSYDTKIHFIGDIDDNPAEENNPYYYNIGFEGSIDNVSVKEVVESWTFASQSGGEAYVDLNTQQIYTAGTGTESRGIAHITFEMTLDMNYKVAFKVDRPTDSVIKLGPTPDSSQYGQLVIEDVTTGGVFDEQREFVFTAPVSGIAYLTLATTGNGFTYWDDISVKSIPSLSSDEYLLLARSMNILGVPIGGEARWKQANLDLENQDYTGMPTAGHRTLESFGESIIEDYYDVNRRGNEIMNPPISLSEIDKFDGFRFVDEIVPSCTTDFGFDTYATEVLCETVVGVWNPTVPAYCTNGDYVDEVECELPFGTWTPEGDGSCSDTQWTSEYYCLAEGTCSDPTYSFETFCLSAGTCTNTAYNDDQGGCLAEGTCSDPLISDQTSCTDAGAVWTSAGNVWTSAGNTWTSAGNTWTAGDPAFCSDGVQTSESTCIGPRGTWVIEAFENCNTSIADLVVDNQVDCETPRGTWDSTVVAAINGDTVTITGDGIDTTYEIELGGVLQVATNVNLPYKVSFVVNPVTPLGLQDLMVTNADGDSATFVDQFLVEDRLRIITVHTHCDSTGATASCHFDIYGAGFIPGDTVVEFISTDGGSDYNMTEMGQVIINNAGYLTLVHTDIIPGAYDVRVTNLDGQTFTEVGDVLIP